MINATRQKETLRTAEGVLTELETAYASVQADLDALTANKEIIKSAILDQMAILFPENESAKWTSPRSGGTLTRVYANRFKFDVAKFAALLPAKILAKVTRPVVDSKAYIVAVETGLVDDIRLSSVGAVESVRDTRLIHEGGK